MRAIFFALFSLMMSGCALHKADPNAAEKFYYQYIDVSQDQDYELIQPSASPRLIFIEDMVASSKELQSKRYVAIGRTGYDGGYQENFKSEVSDQAKKIGASVALLQISFLRSNISTTSNPLGRR